MATSEVWAGKVNTRYNVVTDEAVCIGKIEFNSLPEAFVKTLRLYNKNANRHLYDPQFIFKGKVYTCSYLGEESRTGRGTTHYWALSKTSASSMPVTFSMYSGVGGKIRMVNDYVLTIPKSKVNDRDWMKYIEYY